MSRIANAWRALMGAEPEVREVEVAKTVTETILGDPQPVTVFRASTARDNGRAFSYSDLGYYSTCAQAHAEHPGVTVTAVQVWRIGNKYLTNLRVRPIEVKKPKRAKGAK